MKSQFKQESPAAAEKMSPKGICEAGFLKPPGLQKQSVP
ncbi:hypothetical protein BH11BAC5_BH11BAC5_00290 [soil metagenome]